MNKTISLKDIFNIITYGTVDIKIHEEVIKKYKNFITFTDYTEGQHNTWGCTVYYKQTKLGEFNSTLNSFGALNYEVAAMLISTISRESLEQWNYEAEQFTNFLKTLGLPNFKQTSRKSIAIFESSGGNVLHIEKYILSGEIEISLRNNGFANTVEIKNGTIADVKYVVEKYREWTHPSLTSSVYS